MNKIEIKDWLCNGSINPLIRNGVQLSRICNDENDLKHPYITKQLARLFISYRKMHGDFKNVNELKILSFMDDELFEKLVPYLVVD